MIENKKGVISITPFERKNTHYVKKQYIYRPVASRYSSFFI